MTNQAALGSKNNRVGPILRSSDITEAIIEAVHEDNPGKDIRVDDKLAYVRIDTDTELIIRQKTLEKMIGRPFSIAELEIHLGSFAGRIETTSEHMRFYFNKTV
jgi:toluene monooxygenase system protein D